MHAHELIASIDRAFDGAPRTDTSLRQFQLTDLYGMDDDFPQQEWSAAGSQRTDRNWQAISDAELEADGFTLSHMQADDFRYFLPAYLRHVLTHLPDPGWQSDVAGMTLAALTPSEHPGSARERHLGRYAALNAMQQAAIRHFLVFLANNDDAAELAHAASQALDHYWSEAVDTLERHGWQPA